MLLTGYQIMEAIAIAKQEVKQAEDTLNGAVWKFPDEENPQLEVIEGDLVRLRDRLIRLRVAQRSYNDKASSFSTWEVTERPVSVTELLFLFGEAQTEYKMWQSLKESAYPTRSRGIYSRLARRVRKEGEQEEMPARSQDWFVERVRYSYVRLRKISSALTLANQIQVEIGPPALESDFSLAES